MTLAATVHAGSCACPKSTLSAQQSAALVLPDTGADLGQRAGQPMPDLVKVRTYLNDDRHTA